MKIFTQLLLRSFLFTLFFLPLMNTNAQTLPNYVPASGIVAWYPFNNNAMDESGNGNDGTLYTPTATTDRFSNATSAYAFVNDSIEIVNPSNFQLTTFTISAWINCFNARFDYETIFKNFGQVGFDYTGYWFGVYTDVLTFGMYDGATGWTELNGTTNLNDGLWHHVVVTYDGITGAIYVDGVLEASAAESITYTPTTVTIGNDYLDEYFEGSIDDIGVWSRALSSCEIENLFNASIATGTDTRSECAPYTWIDGNTYSTNNNTATYVIAGGASSGCDSLAVLDLTILTAPDVSVSTSGVTITANATTSTFEWIDCNNNNAIIPGETGSSYTASSNGSYAVIVDNGLCKDTSSCVMINSVGIDESDVFDHLRLFPNPTHSNFTIELGTLLENVSVKIKSISGQLILTENYNSTQRINLELNAADGIYFIELSDTNGYSKTMKLIKN